MVLTLVFLTVLLGMAAAVIDVGAWYRAHRQTQSTADATALAGAQELPDSAFAKTLALDYAGRNGGGVGSSDVTFTSEREANDTIHVTARRTVPGLFTKLFGVNSVTARGTAAARTSPMGSAKWVAPIGVDYTHDKLHCNVSLVCNPEFGVDTSLDLIKSGPGAFRLINIDGSRGGTPPGVLADWMLNGYSGDMPLDWYFSDPGAKWNNNSIQAAMQARYGTDLLFPVYDQLINQGSNAEYHIIGWASFHLTDAQASGTSGTLTGYFTQVIWEGLVDQSGPSNPEIPDLGVHSVALVD